MTGRNDTLAFVQRQREARARLWGKDVYTLHTPVVPAERVRPTPVNPAALPPRITERERKMRAEEYSRMIPRHKVAHIIQAVAERYSLPYDFYREVKRSSVRVEAKRELYYRLRMDLQMSYSEIGRRLGKDHSTIRYLAAYYANAHDLPLK